MNLLSKEGTETDSMSHPHLKQSSKVGGGTLSQTTEECVIDHSCVKYNIGITNKSSFYQQGSKLKN